MATIQWSIGSGHGKSGSPGGSQSPIWTEQYRPTQPDQLVISDTARTDIVNWFKHRTGDLKPTKVAKKTAGLLLTGPAGVGKTSAGRVYLNHFGYQVIELNASDTRSRSMLDAKLSHIVRNHWTSRKYGFLIDELDGLSTDDRGGLQYLTEIITEYGLNGPAIVGISNTFDKKIKDTLGKCCQVVKFYRPNKSMVDLLIDRISKLHRVSMSPSQMGLLRTQAHGDYRQLVTLMCLPDPKFTGQVKTVTKTMTPFDSVSRVFDAERSSVLDILNLYRMDRDIITHMVHEYYHSEVGSHRYRSRCKPVIYNQTIDAQIQGEVFHHFIQSEQSWYLDQYRGLASCVVPSYVARDVPSGTTSQSYNRWTSYLQVHHDEYLARKRSRKVLSIIDGLNTYNLTDLRVLGELYIYMMFVTQMDKSEPSSRDIGALTRLFQFYGTSLVTAVKTILKYSSAGLKPKQKSDLLKYWAKVEVDTSCDDVDFDDDP